MKFGIQNTGDFLRYAALATAKDARYRGGPVPEVLGALAFAADIDYIAPRYMLDTAFEYFAPQIYQFDRDHLGDLGALEMFDQRDLVLMDMDYDNDATRLFAEYGLIRLPLHQPYSIFDITPPFASEEEVILGISMARYL